MEEQNPIRESNSLETLDTSTGKGGVVEAPSTEPGVVSTMPTVVSARPKNGFLKRIFKRINVYIFLLVIVLLALGGVSYYAIVHNRKSSSDSSLNSKQLSQADLAKLNSSDVSVGDAKQTLNVASNAIFSGGVLVKGGLDVAGTIKVGGSFSLPGITVGGISALEQVQAKSLTVSGDTALQGKVNIQNNLTVTGSASFSGAISAPQITIDVLQINRDLQLNHHIVAGGGTPGRTSGSALGSGGTASVGGSDTAGTVTINTGGGAPAGCFITVNFAAAFASTPRVVISPVGSSAAALNYYVNRTAAGFSVCTVSDPPDNTAGITFDYIVIN